jgi:hypothetical protein
VTTLQTALTSLPRDHRFLRLVAGGPEYFTKRRLGRGAATGPPSPGLSVAVRAVMSNASVSRRVFGLFGLPLAVALLGAGCDGSSLGDGPFTTTPGQSVLTAKVSKVTVSSTGGGFVGPRPAGAPCDPGQWTLSVTFDGGVLTWDRCDVAGTGEGSADYTVATGTRTLSGTELARARTVAGSVLVSDRRTCGADKPYDTLEAATASAKLVYGDDFYGCEPNYQQFVESDGLDSLAAALLTLSRS